MTTRDDVYLEQENVDIARVLCTRCHEQIGRVQVVTAATEGDAPFDRRDVEGELLTIASDHAPLCPGQAKT